MKKTENRNNEFFIFSSLCVMTQRKSETAGIAGCRLTSGMFSIAARKGTYFFSLCSSIAFVLISPQLLGCTAILLALIERPLLRARSSELPTMPVTVSPPSLPHGRSIAPGLLSPLHMDLRWLIARRRYRGAGSSTCEAIDGDTFGNTGSRFDCNTIRQLFRCDGLCQCQQEFAGAKVSAIGTYRMR